MPYAVVNGAGVVVEVVEMRPDTDDGFEVVALDDVTGGPAIGWSGRQERDGRWTWMAPAD